MCVDGDGVLLELVCFVAFDERNELLPEVQGEPYAGVSVNEERVTLETTLPGDVWEIWAVPC